MALAKSVLLICSKPMFCAPRRLHKILSQGSKHRSQQIQTGPVGHDLYERTDSDNLHMLQKLKLRAQHVLLVSRKSRGMS
jgi:hypothetical protein